MIEKIMNSFDLLDIIDAINEFCREVNLRENDDICFELKERIGASDNDIHRLISAYLSAAEDGDEIVDVLYEFMANCKGFAEADQEKTQQVTKEEFEAVLDEYEDKCNLRSCIEDEHVMNIAEVGLVNNFREFGLRVKGNIINLFLPRIDNDKNARKYIAEELGIILYDVLTTRLNEQFIRTEIERYIPAGREANMHTRRIFKRYFYDVLLYKEQKPQIYTHLDENMQRIFVVEVFRKLIEQYMKLKE